MSENSLTITIPLFIEEVKLSSSRRKKHFRKKDKIPDKYIDMKDTISGTLKKFKVLKNGLIWKKHGKEEHLYDIESKSFIVANPVASGTPNIMRISGNEIYARMHERKRMIIVAAIKKDFTKYLPSELGLKLPMKITIELYTTPKICNWDLDNMWIYNKCFQDLLIDRGLIPDDNVRYITLPGAPRFFPVVDEADRRMVFTLTEDNHPKIRSHIMFDLDTPKEFSYIGQGVQHVLPSKYYQIKRGLEGKVGDLYIDGQARTFYVQMGKKKIIHGGLIKGLGRVYSQCIQMNCFPYVDQKFYNSFRAILKKELLDKGVPVYITRLR